MLSFEINLSSITHIFRYCTQIIAVRFTIACFRLSDFLLIISRTPAYQTSSTDNVDKHWLIVELFRFSYVKCYTNRVSCYWPAHRVSSSSISQWVLVSRLGSYVSVDGNGIWYAFATRMVGNAASINMRPQSALYTVLPVNIICRIALPANTSRGALAVLSLLLNVQYYKGSSFACVWTPLSLTTIRLRSLPVETLEVHCLRISSTRVGYMWGWEWHQTA